MDYGGCTIQLSICLGYFDHQTATGATGQKSGYGFGQCNRLDLRWCHSFDDDLERARRDLNFATQLAGDLAEVAHEVLPQVFDARIRPYFESLVSACEGEGRRGDDADGCIH